LPRGKWATVSIKLETKKKLEEACSGYPSLDDCLSDLFTVNRGSGAGRPSQFTVNSVCDELVEEAASLLLVQGYAIHARLLREMYAKRAAKVDLEEALRGVPGVVLSHFASLPPASIFFNAYREGGRWVLEVKRWLRPCFM
jgi:hypothetical protein